MDNVEQLLKEYNVESEDELNKKMAEDALTIPCIVCKKEKPIDKLSFKSGNPICLDCLK